MKKSTVPAVTAALALIIFMITGCTGLNEDAGKSPSENQAQKLISPIPEGAAPDKVAEGFKFTEGPVAFINESVLFSDVRSSRIYKMSGEGKITIFRENVNGTNGLAFDKNGNLIVCEGGNGRMISISPDGEIAVVCDSYEGKRFNMPNDLWVDHEGGVYFSDPVYGGGETIQNGEHVYYVTPGRSKVLRVISDMIRPNGMVGTADGKTLYVADHGAGKTWRYTIVEGGALAEKTLFAERGSDGMTIDSMGNIYLVGEAVYIYSSSGKEIGRIEVPVRPTNLCFYGRGERQRLFITARTHVFSIQTNVRGVNLQER